MFIYHAMDIIRSSLLVCTFSCFWLTRPLYAMNVLMRIALEWGKMPMGVLPTWASYPITVVAGLH